MATNSTRPDEPEHDLYTIPGYSSWFRWDDIHETERAALREFFDGTSITRTPRIYKEYRDFIINKYREDPSRRLTFTELRKSLIGDVTLLLKVFRFLDVWGLINFSAINPDSRDDTSDDKVIVRVEDGAPNGIRVVATPNSLRPISVKQQQQQQQQQLQLQPHFAAESAEAVGFVGSGVKLPPLSSYSDVFGDLGKAKGCAAVCGSCGGSCDGLGRYEHNEGNYTICVKCFNEGRYGENKAKDDFKLHDSVDNSSIHEAVWTEAETLLLLESVLRHGDDWDLVAQNVQTKTKLDCISKLIELPFGDLILPSTYGRGNSNGLSGNTKQVPLSSSKKQDSIKNEDQLEVQMNVNEQSGDGENEDPPSKRKRDAPLSDAGSSMMKQVALIATMASPAITAAAADAAVAVLCNETSCPRDIFDGEEDFLTNGLWSPTLHSEPDRAHPVEDLEMKGGPIQSETQETSPVQNDMPLTLRLRAAIATALGAAAAQAKLLADQEDREIENLVATIIETQLKKLDYKIKHFDNLELIMEKEYAELEELKESITEERIDVLHRTISAGIPKWKDRPRKVSQC